MHIMILGYGLPNFPLLQLVLWAYRKWEEHNFLKDDVRSWLSAEQILRVFAYLAVRYICHNEMRPCRFNVRV